MRHHDHPPIPAWGDGLLLGWETDGAGAPFGFATKARVPASRPEPLLYKGDGHVCTFAPTGAGKGRSALIPNLLTYRGPVIVIDPKGEAYQVTARRRRELGQPVYKLDPFHVVSDTSDRLNPLDIMQLEGSLLDCDAEMLATLLAVGHQFQSDPFWTDTASGVIGGLIAHVASTAPPEERSLNQLRSFIYHDDMDYALAVLLDAKKVTCPFARDEIVAYLSHPADRTRPCVRSTATTYIKALGSAPVAETLASSSFDLHDVVAGKPMSIYIVIPPEKLESHKALLRLWVGTLLTAVARRRRIPPQRTLFLLDEVGQLGEFSALRQSITLLRGYGLQIWSYWQDLSQLRLLYPKDWPTILNNSAVLQIFGLSNHLMAEEWSKVLGRDPSELLQAGPDEAFANIRDGAFHRCLRADYLRDRTFSGLFDPNERFSLLPPIHDPEPRGGAGAGVGAGPDR